MNNQENQKNCSLTKFFKILFLQTVCERSCGCNYIYISTELFSNYSTNKLLSFVSFIFSAKSYIKCHLLSRAVVIYRRHKHVVQVGCCYSFPIFKTVVEEHGFTLTYFTTKQDLQANTYAFVLRNLQFSLVSFTQQKIP